MNLFSFLVTTFLGKDVAARTHGKNFVEFVQTDKPITEKNLFVLWVGYIF
jgi:hypothetical protein